MSYDLYFTLEHDNGDLSDDQFRQFFESRQHYSAESSGQYIYENDDTGVYFTFCLERDSEEEDETWVSFSVNLYRPSYFIFEAKSEVSEFCNTFSVTVDDPQDDNVRLGKYNPERFLKLWNVSNKVAYQTFLETGIEAPYALPTRILETIWRWNYERERYQSSLGTDVFVPKIMFFLESGDLKTGVVWPDGIAAAVPDVDVVIIDRDDLAPRRLLRKSKGVVIANRSNFLQAWSEFERPIWPVEHTLLNYTRPTDLIRDIIIDLPDSVSDGQVIAADSVLNEELVSLKPNAS